MAALFLPLAMLAAAATAAAPITAPSAPQSARQSPAGEASFTVSARIIANPARIGRDYPPPRPNMVARRATTTAADGREVPALIYDFE
jgi:hypothetical protein